MGLGIVRNVWERVVQHGWRRTWAPHNRCHRAEFARRSINIPPPQRTGKQLGTAMCQMVMEYIPHACKNNMFDNYTTPLAETRSSGAGSSLAISDGGSSGFAVEAWLNLGERRACWQRFFWHAWEKRTVICMSCVDTSRFLYILIWSLGYI